MNISISSQYERSTPTSREIGELKARIFAEVEKCLESIGISRASYVLGGESNSGQLCIDVDGDLWSVFTSERGERYNPGFFFDAWSAANYFVWELMRTEGKFSNHPSIAFKF